MTTYFGAQGLFVALFVGLFVAELLTRLGNNKNLLLKCLNKYHQQYLNHLIYYYQL